MKITDLEIDQFGIWRDLTLPLSGGGLNLFYGPNEAGKSTLKRFVRAMLFGGMPPISEEEDSHRFPNEIVASGSLWMTHEQESYHLSRRLTAAGGGQLELMGPNDTLLPDGRLGDLLGGTSEAVFDRLFAIDLYELQELARLDHHELAGHVYGLSLGTHGRGLLRSVEDLRSQKARLISTNGKTGRLSALVAEEQSLIEQLRSLPNLPEARGDLIDRRDRIDADIATLKQRRGELQQDLRGRRHLGRVHPVWRQVRDYDAELSRFSTMTDLPPDGLRQLDELDQETETLARRREDSQHQASEAKRRAEGLGPEPEIVRAEPAVRAMLGMRSWVEETEASRDAAPQPSATPPPVPARSVSTADLGPEWTADRLANVDTTPQAQLALLEAARRYRLALGRRSVLRKRYRKHQNALKKREVSVEDRLHRLGKSPDVVAADLRRELASAESLAELRAKETVYAQRSGTWRRRAERFAEAFEIPPWVTAVLALFALAGAVFAVLGLITGVTHSAVAGAAYLLLGLTSGSIAVKLRSHFENAIEETTERSRGERDADEAELRTVREELRRLGAAPSDREPGRSNSVGSGDRSTSKSSIADQVRGAVKQFGDLDDLVSAQARIRTRRKDLTRLRERLRKVQQSVESARQDWCQTLVRCGLPESLDIKQSLETWQRIAENVPPAVVTVASDTGEVRGRLEKALSSFGTELETFGRRLGIEKIPAGGPLAILDDWERRLDRALEVSREKRRHLAEQERHLETGRNCEQRLAELARQQTALLAAAGVRSRADYEERLRAAAEREELREYLRLSEMELDTLAAAEPDLAIVEDDLLAYRDDDNRQTIQRLLQEQEELEARLETALEQRGQIARQLDELAGDDRALRLSKRKARVETLLKRTASRLLAVSLAGEAAESARLTYERERQPAVLRAASEILARLTRGRYSRIWSPLGERAIRVDDDRNRTFAIEQLSSGTREQLLLALRLGMVNRASEQGIELPLILDDVFVNFDQLRTEAAFETLQQLAEEGRQILFFTCHLHLANLAEQRGVAPIWLPGHHSPLQQRLVG